MPFDKFISVIDYEEAEMLAQNNNQIRIYSKINLILVWEYQRIYGCVITTMLVKIKI